MGHAVEAPAKVPLFEVPAGSRTRGLGSLEAGTGAGAGAGATKIRLPLAKVEIAARVADRVAEVTVAQTFQNPLTEALEAVYIFPLPGGAAVGEFQLRVGARTIHGVVKERGEARRDYDQALAEGKRAALLEQERDDVFTVQVGNLPPGEEVTVRLRYSERLAYFEDGTTELRLPTVVAPRYIPGTPLDGEAVGDGVEPDTDVVPDASRITPPRLALGFDPGVGLGIEVELVCGEGAPRIDDLACSQHATRTAAGPWGVKVSLAQADERLDRDFVLRWRLAGDELRPSLAVHAGDGAAYGLLSIVPPRREGFLGLARDVVFLVDRSGSMSGPKMASAARACAILLATLGPRDRFAIQAFDNVVEWLDEGRFQRADEAGIDKGERFLREIDARGGTAIDAALAEALRAIGTRREADDGTDRVPVIVLLTDGQVGDESRVLKRIQRDLADARVFTVGVDTAPNEGFLTRLAKVGGGTCTFVAPGAHLEDALRGVAREIGTPLLTDVKIEDVDAGLEVDSIAPAAIPDVFAGRAGTVFFRAKRAGRVRVRGTLAGGSAYEAVVDARPVSHPAIAHLWAKARVQDLEDRFRIGANSSQDALKREIIEIAVAHAILTRFTAFVVVDEAEVANPDGTRRKVVQPVEMPAKWEMEADGAVSRSREAMSLAGGFAAPGLLAQAPMPGGAPPAPAQAFAPEAQASGGFLKRVADLFAPRPKKEAAKGRAARLARRVQEPAGTYEVVPAKEREAVEAALRAFAEAIERVCAEVAAGRVPAGEALEKARRTLLDALGASALGERVPALQRFLRAGAAELVAALRAGGEAAALRPLVERHAKAFEAARAEAEAALGQSRSAGKPFWEGSV